VAQRHSLTDWINSLCRVPLSVFAEKLFQNAGRRIRKLIDKEMPARQ
jgi:hypothetical protein